MWRILTGLLLVVSWVGGASAADYGSVPGPAFTSVPACDASGIAWRISEKFAYQDRHIVHSGVTITGIDNMHETGGPQWQSRIERRYCGATAWLSDGSKSEVVYLIEGPHLGALTHGWHVESCVNGHDPYRVHDNVCRSIRALTIR